MTSNIKSVISVINDAAAAAASFERTSFARDLRFWRVDAVRFVTSRRKNRSNDVSP